MRSDLLKPWLVLLCLQVFAALLVFSEFLTGKFYFAYLDIGSDSHSLWVPQAMHLARSWARDGFVGWSFQLGLGGPTAVMLGDLANLIGQSVGVENILPARIRPGAGSPRPETGICSTTREGVVLWRQRT